MAMCSLFDLGGRVALVTGGNGGIGLGMARGLASAGASIVVAARDAQKSEAAVQALRALGADAVAISVDVTDETSVDAMIVAAVAWRGRLDVLVNNAGINIRKPAQDLSLGEWHRVLDTNLTSAFLCSRGAYPHMKRAGAGKIVNVGSMLSIFGASFGPVYGASKGGIVQLTKSLAVTWAPDNIQVNAVLPGWVDTDLTRRGRKDIPGLDDKVLAGTPAGRWGRIDDFAGIAVFLASAASGLPDGHRDCAGRRLLDAPVTASGPDGRMLQLQICHDAIPLPRAATRSGTSPPGPQEASLGGRGRRSAAN